MNTLLWWLAQNTLTLCVLIPLVALACRLFCHRPAVQHLLWVVVLVKFLTPPLVAWPWSLDEVRSSLWPASNASVAAWITNATNNDPHAVDLAYQSTIDMDRASDTKNLSVAERSPTVPELDSVELARLRDSRRAETSPLDRDLAEFSASADADGPNRALASLLWLVTGLWLAGAVVCLARHVRRIVRHAGLLRHAAPAPPQLKEEIETIARSLSLRPPGALLSSRIRSPFVWCFGRIRLVWPGALAGSGDIVRSRGVIAHELAHIRRGDHFVAWLELVALVVWWWNPLFWLARRRLRESAEMACDALAIAAFPDQRAEYAELLLQLSTDYESRVPAPVLAVGALSPASFERRLTMILSQRVSGKVSARGILLAICIALVAVPGWALGQAEPETPKTAPSTDPNLTSSAATEPAAAAPATSTGEDSRLDPATKRDHTTPAAATEPKAENPLTDPTLQPQTTKPGLTLQSTDDVSPLERIKKLEAENRALLEMLHVLQNQAKARQKESKSADPSVRPTEEKLDSRYSKMKTWSNRAAKVEYNRRGQATVKLSPDEAYTRAAADLPTIRKRLEDLQAQKPAANPELLDQAKRDLVVAEQQLREIVQVLKQQQVDSKVADQQRLAADADYQALLKQFQKGPENSDRESWAALLKMTQARAAEQVALQKKLAEAAAAQAKTAQDQAQRQAQALAAGKGDDDARANTGIPFALAKSFAQPTPDNPLDVAERYLRAEADLKTARGRLGRIKKSEASGVVSQQDIEDLEIELERADKLCRLLTTYIHEARRSAALAKEAAQGEYNRTEQLYKAAAISRSELDGVKARLDEVDSRVRQYEAIGAIVPQGK